MSGITEDKHMAYIGFLLGIVGLAAAGGAIDRDESLIGAMVMTAAGAVLMWLDREENEDSEEENSGSGISGSSPVDKPSGESGRGCGEDPQR